MTKGLVLKVLTFFSFLYCFRLGYIWTPYGHGMKFFIGLHFPLVMTISIFAYGVSVEKFMKQLFFVAGLIYFLTVCAFSLTIEYLIETKKNYFNFLYYESGGYVDKIFFAWIAIGLITFLITFRQNIKFRLFGKFNY